MMGIKTDDFRRATKDCGPGGWKCSCCGPAEGSKRLGRRAARHRLKMNIKNELANAEIEHDEFIRENDVCDEFVACIDFDCGNPDCNVCVQYIDEITEAEWNHVLDEECERERDLLNGSDDFLEEIFLEEMLRE